MSGISDEEVDLYRRIAAESHGSRQFAGTLVTTSYDKKAHAIKGIVQPHGFESGWIPIGVVQTGGNSGAFYGPKVGDATKLDGDQFEISYDNGDPNTIVARPRMSKPDNPPVVESGEVLVQDTNGSSIHFKQDKSIVTTHGVKGGTQTWDKDGHLSVITKGMKLSVDSGGGDMSFDAGSGSHSFKGAGLKIEAPVTVKGDITQQGSLTSSGTINGTGGVTSSGSAVKTV